MSLWWTRDENGRRSLISVEGIGFVACLGVVLIVALVAWLVS
jgi:hypothetical protein